MSGVVVFVDGHPARMSEVIGCKPGDKGKCHAGFLLKPHGFSRLPDELTKLGCFRKKTDILLIEKSETMRIKTEKCALLTERTEYSRYSVGRIS